MKFVNYKILIGGALIIIFVILLVNTGRELLTIQKNGSLIKQLENELERKENHNKFLQEQLKYVQTEDFIEKESRERLGLVKPGEVVVQERFESKIQENIQKQIEKPNWKQWMELFF